MLKSSAGVKWHLGCGEGEEGEMVPVENAISKEMSYQKLPRNTEGSESIK